MADRYRTVDEFLAAQEPARRAQVDALRGLVHEAEPGLVEIVKWNSPDYTLDGVDRLTINAAGRGPVRLILHFGTARAEDRSAEPSFSGDPDGLLTWHSNIRASLVAPGLESASEPESEPADAAARARVVAVIRAWLAAE
ncbi:DUF1801 domain-containing protein [Agromyces sp. NPDC058126]|uniref:DUF1801 domain-containing protein n=1 Tax=Agromyces sp. NPDC058126 TaxID=3346350 RepID=UPI0036DE1C04